MWAEYFYADSMVRTKKRPVIHTARVLDFIQIVFKRLCGYNMGEERNSIYGGGAGGGVQKTFYGPYDMVYWLPDLPAP